jgi:hypothetical protein
MNMLRANFSAALHDLTEDLALLSFIDYYSLATTGSDFSR